MRYKRNTLSLSISAEIPECTVEEKVQKSTRARLIKKVYGANVLICPRCGSEMKILAVIINPALPVENRTCASQPGSSFTKLKHICSGSSNIKPGGEIYFLSIVTAGFLTNQYSILG